MKPSLLTKAIVGLTCALVLTVLAGAPIAQATGLINLTDNSSESRAAQDGSTRWDRLFYEGAGTVPGTEPTASPTQSAGTVAGPSVGTGDGSSQGGAVVGISLTLVGLVVLGGVFALSRLPRPSS